jgi:hypothetical protein
VRGTDGRSYSELLRELENGSAPCNPQKPAAQMNAFLLHCEPSAAQPIQDNLNRLR